ncbi:MAG: DoxX family protein [Deltaproteobacteria bacterium]|nr:DoxX family protein [Nannocystaceae bacterium]
MSVATVSTRRWLDTAAPRSVVLVRGVLGFVFVTEGIQKLLYPEALGAGRFASIGIPAPELMGPFVGVLEIVCGLLVLAGWLTRPAAILLLVDMIVAMLSTKLPILLGHGFWGFADPSAARTGFWSASHEARTDLAMATASAFLVIVGAGAWSLDAVLARRRAATEPRVPR